MTVTKCNGFGKSKEFVLPSITHTYVGGCLAMLNVFLALIGHFLAPYEAILAPYEGYVGPIWGYVGPMWAYLRLMLGLCWAYLDPFLAYRPRSRILTPFEKHAKTQDSRAKMHPPKLKLVSYNAIANGSSRHTKNASAPSVRADL